MKPRSRLCLLVIPLLCLLLPAGSQARSNPTTIPYMAETTTWRAAAGKFANWQRDGVLLSPGRTLQLDLRAAHAGTDPYGPGQYKGGDYYNGGSFLVGEATSPVAESTFPFSSAIPSWNASTPPGTWIEAQLRVRMNGSWTAWYSMGVWASGQDVVARHSVSEQVDADAYVDVDTLKIGKRGKPLTPAANAYQLKFRLFSDRQGAVPGIENAAVTVSTNIINPPGLVQGNPALWGKSVQVPECSQMVYPDGGEVWCSPTSVAMVLNYWKGQVTPCETSVRAAVSGVYDRIYEGHGNWPFNTAYAYATGQGMEAYVARFSSLAKAEEWIAAGVPVIMSISWGRGQLTGAPIPASNGHLVVLSGFDGSGNPIVNDPAAASNDAVKRTYQRSEFERLWLQASGGTVYLIYPAGKSVPGF